MAFDVRQFGSPWLMRTSTLLSKQEKHPDSLQCPTLHLATSVEFVCVSRLSLYMVLYIKCVFASVSDLVIIWRVGLESNWGRGGVRHTEINLNTED